MRAPEPPKLDGRADDPIWASAMPITDFQVFEPSEGGKPLFPTEARVAYDARNLYVLVRAFDPHPDSIIAPLGRRDVRVAGDHIKVMIDSYRDRRTGFEFAVNPAGVKRDYAIYEDSEEDISWDAVWDVATRIDSAGWVAEFQIPLSQLRYAPAESHTFGLNITRDIGRVGERSAWPLYRRSVRGISSQFGDLTGLAGLSSRRRVEVAPYTLVRNRSAPATVSTFRRTQEMTGGADIKLGLTSNLTLDATVNPDFGQVEADPAVINLSAFEVGFEEKRPFFLEGTSIFGFTQWAELFYSRRIGRAPQLAGLVADPTADLPGSTTIQGAMKLTGRLASGVSLGVLGARTGESRVGDLQIEPATSFGVARLRQNWRDGNSEIGAMFTTVHRDLSDATAPYLRRDAITGGIDGRHRFWRNRWQLMASLAGSRVTGSRQAITRTQRSSVHYYQRPDAGLGVDTTRTSLAGVQVEGVFEKIAGVHRMVSRALYTTPGFEVNDLGFQQRADWMWYNLGYSYRTARPNKLWRSANGYLESWLEYSSKGVSNANSIESGWQTELHNRLRLSADFWVKQPFSAFCDRCARGGPAVRLSPFTNLLVNASGDARKTVIPSFAAIYTVGDDGRTTLWRVRPYVTVRNASNISWELGTRYQRNRDNTQWYTNRGVIGADSTHYVFAHLDQHLLSFTARANYIFSPTLSFQYYAEPFVSTGRYFGFRELADPRAKEYDARFRPTTAVTSSPGFNQKSFNSNAVLRWEYRPGSTIYAVWQQNREQFDRDPGVFDARRDYRNLFVARPDNTFLIKGSYWLNW